MNALASFFWLSDSLISSLWRMFFNSIVPVVLPFTVFLDSLFIQIQPYLLVADSQLIMINPFLALCWESPEMVTCVHR